MANILLESIINNKKYQTLIANAQAQLNHGRIVLKTKVNQIKNHDDKIIKQSSMLIDGSIIKKLLEDKGKERKCLTFIMKNLDNNQTNRGETFQHKLYQKKEPQEMKKSLSMKEVQCR